MGVQGARRPTHGPAQGPSQGPGIPRPALHPPGLPRRGPVWPTQADPLAPTLLEAGARSCARLKLWNTGHGRSDREARALKALRHHRGLPGFLFHSGTDCHSRPPTRAPRGRAARQLSATMVTSLFGPSPATTSTNRSPARPPPGTGANTGRRLPPVAWTLTSSPFQRRRRQPPVPGKRQPDLPLAEPCAGWWPRACKSATW
jgi:hypothetical protein